MSSNLDFPTDALLDLPFDPREQARAYTTTQHAYANSMAGTRQTSWHSAMEMPLTGGGDQRATSPNHQGVHHHQHQHQQFHPQHANHSPTLLDTDWPLPQQATQQLQQYTIPDASMMGSQFQNYTNTFHTSPIDYHMPPNMPTNMPTTQPGMGQGLQMEAPYSAMPPATDGQITQWGMGMGMANWQDFEAAMMYSNPSNDGLPAPGGRQSLGSLSPTGTYMEVISLPSSSSDNGWATVDTYQNFETYQQAHNAAIFNPGQTLHLRSHSDSSQSDSVGLEVFGSYEEISYPPYSPYSPGSDGFMDPVGHRNCYHESHPHSHEIVSPAAAVGPVPIMTAVSSRTSPSSTSSPPRRPAAPKKSPTTKASKPAIRRNSNGKKEGEKRVGRRRGPLLPEQRKQASEIRKLRACLRCKFLKKTCDKGEPCAGCQPSHARLWQVPCTRIDIKDIAYFLKDWKADYDRHVGLGVTVYNIKGFAQKEELMWITHGYGYAIPIQAREVYVTDDTCFNVTWVESNDELLELDVRTEKMSAGSEGIPRKALDEYLDKHLDGGFEEWVDNHFDTCPFVSDILKTAYRYWQKEKVPVIRKALKLVLAYNLTTHITMVESNGDESEMDGRVDDEDSRFHGKIIAPVMINFQIKCAMADMWRQLQKDVLEELSSLYSSVYSGDRLKNWPTIFMIASILLAVWEEMQFDCHYRVADPAMITKFCTDMETTPVGVIVGLFHAISQKLPAFTEWETRRHGQLLNNNPAVCDAMTEMRGHIIHHEDYLRTRSEAKFDRNDFDSLSNKFLSKLVIRAN